MLQKWHGDIVVINQWINIHEKKSWACTRGWFESIHGEVKSCNCNEIEGEETKVTNPRNITKFLGSHIFYKKSDAYLTQYLTNLVIIIAKGYIPLSMLSSMVLAPCVIVWSKGRFYISKVIGKIIYSMNSAKDYGRIYFC